MSEIKELDAILRSHLSWFIRKVFQIVAPGETYLHAWYIDAMAYELERILRGETSRLLITIPPRHLKSICASVAFPAWVLGHDPTCNIICVSYSESLAIKHANDCRAVMESAWYRRCFPKTRIDPSKNTQTEFMTTRRGGRLATSVGGTLTGRGANLIIGDDLNKPDEVESDAKRDGVNAWYGNTLVSRLNNKETDSIILVQQRLHENDLVGHVLEKENWTHLNLPAIAEEDERIAIGEGRYYERKEEEPLHPERESLATLARIKEAMGSYAFAAQYQQRPAPLGGGMVQWKWFQRYADAPDMLEGDLIVQSWDTASKAGEMNDFSVCTTWLVREAHYYLLDVFREKLDYPVLWRRLLGLAQQWSPDLVLIEAANAGLTLYQELRVRTRLNVKPIVPKGDKQTRMYTETPAIEAGRVYIPKAAPWLADFQHEIVRFPTGKYDDQVDSLSQFLYWARMRELQKQQPKCHWTPFYR